MTQDIKTFHGVWKLVEWSVTHEPSQTTRQPFGGNVDGHIIYSPDGWVSATLMEKDRVPVSQERIALAQLKQQILKDPLVSLESDKISQVLPYFLASFGYVSYCGPFEIESEIVHHRIQNSLIPQWVGTTLSRNFVFDESHRQLTLTANQGDTTDKLVWQRLNGI